MSQGHSIEDKRLGAGRDREGNFDLPISTSFSLSFVSLSSSFFAYFYLYLCLSLVFFLLLFQDKCSPRRHSSRRETASAVPADADGVSSCCSGSRGAPFLSFPPPPTTLFVTLFVYLLPGHLSPLFDAFHSQLPSFLLLSSHSSSLHFSSTYSSLFPFIFASLFSSLTHDTQKPPP